MSLQTVITDWRDIYDQTGIGSYNPSYIGSIRDVNGKFHTGKAIYQEGYKIYDTNWYACQGVDYTDTDLGGGKFLLESGKGFSWDAVNINSNSLLEFETSGNLDSLYLGTTPSGDTGPAPAEGTLTTFNDGEPLLVVKGLNMAVNYVAANQFGVTDGNSAISVSATATDGTVLSSILANAQLYETATLNSTMLYSMAFDKTDTQAFEWVLDKYLESRGSDITDTFEDIQTALAGTGVSVDYYDKAGDYASGGVITSSAAAEVDGDLLLAA
ncbi:hypothetical protein AB1F87_001798 [Vibrio mimicus]